MGRIVLITVCGLIILFVFAYSIFFNQLLPSSINFSSERMLKYVLYTIDDQLAKLSRAPAVKIPVPWYRQEHALSCEIAALRMALNYYGNSVDERALLSQLPFSTQEPRSPNNTWGDPDQGFVGDIDGEIPNHGYGVYEDPIVTLATEYRSAEKLPEGNLDRLITALNARHPIIVWGTLASGKDISWMTPEGKFVKAVYGEHARVLYGYEGSAKNPSRLLLKDPIYGNIRMTKAQFLKDWQTLDNKAVIVY